MAYRHKYFRDLYDKAQIYLNKLALELERFTIVDEISSRLERGETVFARCEHRSNEPFVKLHVWKNVTKFVPHGGGTYMPYHRDFINGEWIWANYLGIIAKDINPDCFFEVFKSEEAAMAWFDALDVK